MKRKHGIRDYSIWGLFAAAAIILAFSLSVSKVPPNTEKAAARTQKALSKRMEVLEHFISNSLSADRQDWIGRYDLPQDMVIYRYIEDSLQSWSNQFPVKNDDISSRVVFQRLSRPRENILSTRRSMRS